MPDQSLDIGINIPEGDLSGATAAKEAIQDVTNAQKRNIPVVQEAARTGEGFNLKLKDTNKLVRALTHASPLLGIALKAAFSPIGAVVLAAVTAIKVLHKTVEDAKKKAEELAESFYETAKNTEEVKSKATETAAAFKKGFEEMAASAHSVKVKTDEIVASLTAQKNAIAAIQKAQMDLELAQAKDEPGKARIRLRYAGLSHNLETDFQKLTIAAKEKELVGLKTESGALSKAITPQGTTSARTGLFDEVIKSEIANLASTQSLLEATKTPMGQILNSAKLKARFGKDNLMTGEQMQADLERDVERIKSHIDVLTHGRRTDISATEAEAKRQEDARGKFIKNEDAINALTNELKQLNASLQLNKTTFLATNAKANQQAIIESLPGLQAGAQAGSMGSLLQLAAAPAAMLAWQQQVTKALADLSAAQSDLTRRVANIHN